MNVLGIVRKVEIRLASLELAWVRLLHDRNGITNGLIGLGYALGRDSQLEASERALSEAHRRAVESSDDEAVTRSCLGLASVLVMRKEFDQIISLVDADLVRIRAYGDMNIVADALLKLGAANQERGMLDVAVAAYTESEAVARQNGDWQGVGKALKNLGAVDYLNGQWQGAFQHWTKALAAYQRTRDKIGIADVQRRLGSAAARMGRREEGERFLAESVAILKRAGRPDYANEALYWWKHEKHPIDGSAPSDHQL